MINQHLDTLAIYESKLDDNDSEKMLSLSGYKLVRRDRNKQGGGVFVYERHSLSFNELNEFEEQNFEFIVLEIHRNVFFSLRSIDHQSQINSSCFDYFEFLEKGEPKHKEIYTFGDSNCTCLTNPPEYRTSQLMKTMDALISFQMNQMLLTFKSYNFQDVNRALAAWTKVFLDVVGIGQKRQPKPVFYKFGRLIGFQEIQLIKVRLRKTKKRFNPSRINEASGD